MTRSSVSRVRAKPSPARPLERPGQQGAPGRRRAGGRGATAPGCARRARTARARGCTAVRRPSGREPSEGVGQAPPGHVPRGHAWRPMALSCARSPWRRSPGAGTARRAASGAGQRAGVRLPDVVQPGVVAAPGLGAPAGQAGAGRRRLRPAWSSRPCRRSTSCTSGRCRRRSSDGAGRRHGGAHLGLQWHAPHPGSRAVNWGGYAPGGGILPGSESALPSGSGNANTRDLWWEPAVPTPLTIERAAGGRVGRDGRRHPRPHPGGRRRPPRRPDGVVGGVRPLRRPARGRALVGLPGDPGDAARWSRRVALRVNYQGRSQRRLRQHDSAMPDGDGVRQVTNTPRGRCQDPPAARLELVPRA